MIVDLDAPCLSFNGPKFRILDSPSRDPFCVPCVHLAIISSLDLQQYAYLYRKLACLSVSTPCFDAKQIFAPPPFYSV